MNIGQLGIVIKWEKVKEHLCIERKRGKVILKQDNVGLNASLSSHTTSSFVILILQPHFYRLVCNENRHFISKIMFFVILICDIILLLILTDNIFYK